MADTTKIQVIESFMVRAQTAARIGSKEIRVPMPEGHELAAAIGQVLAQNVTLANQIRDLEQIIGSQVRIDGGNFG